MNLTVWATIAVALFGGIAYLATKHSALFVERFSTPLFLTNAAIFCLLVAFRSGMTIAFTGLLRFVDGAKLDAASTWHDLALETPNLLSWFSVALLIYLFVLRWVAVYIANDEAERAARGSSAASD
jgi:hypothetical protein